MEIIRLADRRRRRRRRSSAEVPNVGIWAMTRAEGGGATEHFASGRRHDLVTHFAPPVCTAAPHGAPGHGHVLSAK